jgi:hypothetical protein
MSEEYGITRHGKPCHPLLKKRAFVTFQNKSELPIKTELPFYWAALFLV